MDERLKTALATWSVDLATRQVTRSANHDSLYGYETNVPFWNIEHFMSHVHGDDVTIFTNIFRDAITKNENFDFEFRVRLPDGGERRLRSTGHVVFDAGGTPRSVIGSTRLAD